MVGDLVYRLYEKRLIRGLRGQRLPHHVGVILDGNRRFARAKGFRRVTEGHRIGAEKVHDLVDWCDELAIPFVTLWLLSTDNLQRDSDELGELCTIIGGVIGRLAEDPRNVARGIRVAAVGALDVVPDELRRVLKEAEESTEQHTGMLIQVAVGYGGRQEITDALRRLLESHRDQGATIDEVIEALTPEAIAGHLYTTGVPDPDLIIRTSGEIRLSGFLLWQSAHSEFYFCDPYWPDFRKTDFLRALREFAQRQRRYGR